MSLLDSVLAAQTTQQDIGVAMLKKAQDGMKQEGAAVVQMVEEAGPQTANEPKPLLDAYA